MKIRHHQVRVLAAIALQRASERELRTLHDLVVELGPSSFVELVRDIEDEIESSLTIGLDRNREYDLTELQSSGLYSELERIRRKELQIPVQRFAELMTEKLREDSSINASAIPSFDSRRGLQAWIKRLVRELSEPDVYRAAKGVRNQLAHDNGSSVWKLR